MNIVHSLLVILGILLLGTQGGEARKRGGGTSCPDAAGCMQNSANWNIKDLGDGAPQATSTLRTTQALDVFGGPTLCCFTQLNGRHMQGM